MISTASVGNVENAGSLPQVLRRLNPREIATRLLPGTDVQVMDATDAQFQESIASQVGIPEDATGWSFDDRCRLVNYCRQHLGLDVFAAKTIPNNSAAGIDCELIGEPDMAQEAQSADNTHTEGDKLDKSLAFMQKNPQANDEMLAAHLGMIRPASARFWRVKANSLLNGTAGAKGE